MWQPEPGWHPLPGGTGASTLGVWRTVVSGRPAVVKRLCAPGPEDPAELRDPRHHGYWKRAALVAQSGVVEDTPGVRATSLTSVEEDDDGITLTAEWVEDSANSGLFDARALGRFAGADLGDRSWLARGQLRERVRLVERRGGWRVLARTTVADVADHLWERRGALLDLLDALPQVPVHGDATCANLVGRTYDDVLAIDWATLGTGPVGSDLALLSLGTREAFDPCSRPTCSACPRAWPPASEVELAAQVTAVLHRLQPRRVGPGPGRPGRGTAGRHLPTPRRGPAPAGAAAPGAAGRGPAGPLRSQRVRLTSCSELLRAARRRRCRTRPCCARRSRCGTSAGAAPRSRGSSPRGRPCRRSSSGSGRRRRSWRRRAPR